MSLLKDVQHWCPKRMGRQMYWQENTLPGWLTLPKQETETAKRTSYCTEVQDSLKPETAEHARNTLALDNATYTGIHMHLRQSVTGLEIKVHLSFPSKVTFLSSVRQKDIKRKSGLHHSGFAKKKVMGKGNNCSAKFSHCDRQNSLASPKYIQQKQMFSTYRCEYTVQFKKRKKIISMRLLRYVCPLRAVTCPLTAFH